MSPADIYWLPSILTNVFQQHRIVLSFFLYYKTKELNANVLSHKLSKVYDSLVHPLLLSNIILYILVSSRKVVSDLTPKIPFRHVNF